MYIVTAMINHSCDFNLNYWTENNKVHLSNNRVINKGEELTISYITETYRP